MHYSSVCSLKCYFCAIAIMLSCVLTIVLTIDANAVFAHCMLTMILGSLPKKQHMGPDSAAESGSLHPCVQRNVPLADLSFV